MKGALQPATLHRIRDGAAKALQAILQQVVVGALLSDFDGTLLADRARDDDEGTSVCASRRRRSAVRA